VGSLYISFALQKHRIQFRDADLEPSRETMIALAGAFGVFQLAQQGVHHSGCFRVQPNAQGVSDLRLQSSGCRSH
jgi:hypothetical protein